jgi:hypothetical protein
LCYDPAGSVNPGDFAVTLFSQLATGISRPLDRMRLDLLRVSGRIGRYFVRHREARVLAGGLLVIGTASGLTLAAPFWLLALGPILWGIPHVLSDFRYLVLRPGLHRRFGLCFGAGLPLAFAGIGWHPVECGLVAAMMAALLAEGAVWKKTVVLAAGAALFWMSVRIGDLAILVFAHAHNFIALALWWSWRPSHGLLRFGVPVAFAVAGVAIWLGWVAPPAAAVAWAPPGMAAGYHLGQLAPGLAEPWALRLVLLFAFAQAVHYGIWLRLIPEEDRPQPSPRTFAASFRALERDFGPLLLWGSLVLMSGLAMWAVHDLVEARAGYLRMALFHGYLELAAAAWLFVGGRRGFEATAPGREGAMA